MKVLGFCGRSNAGKTTLIEGVIAGLKARGQRVSVIKHTHKDFEIDQPGKDSWRHRQAGAFEVLIANRQRLAVVREFEETVEVSVHQLLCDVTPVDWVLVEGFRHGDLPKIEVLGTEMTSAPLYPDDPYVVAVVTAEGAAPPQPTGLPMLSRQDPDAVAQWMVDTGNRFDYDPGLLHDD